MPDKDMISSRNRLFSHADPNLAIREMKSVSSHMRQARDSLHQSL